MKRIMQFIMTLFILSIVVFYMARLAPGDPLRSYYGESVERMSIEEKENAIENLGLNEPVYIQYVKWFKNAASGNFGMSFKYKTNVTEVIGKVWGNTLILGGIAYILTFILAILLGIFLALHEDKKIDRIVCFIGNISNSIPSFWVSLVLILIFGVNLRVLPTSGAYDIGREGDILNRISHLILPLIVLILSHLWYYTYLIRNKILEEIREDYVLLCKAKGVKRKIIIYKHCIKNTLPSIISIMAISIPHIIGGTYVVEKVFSYPGLGTLSLESAQYHDYNMLLILCLITGALVILGNMMGQWISFNIDPRMKYKGKIADEV
ncbi:ABC transporter permease [uncultured Clostridium sp.]|uniref:ABC transporter permease n=1 Tax=uncultured Clostridium sp. TaxID=59620 RepID=UPI00262901A0|nr:ABC transporter permease [uncultured Clostridium sp.]